MLCLLPFGILTTAHAADAGAGLPVVAVVGLHQPSLDEAAQDRAIGALVGAIEATGRFDAWTLPEVAAALRGREKVVLEEGLTKVARQNLANGRTAAAQASWDEARTWLDQAVQEFERTLPGANSTDELWEAFVLQGATWLQQDTPDEAAARAAFARAVALNPQRPADPAQFPPTVTDVFAAVQQERGAQQTAVQLGGSGTVWVDGVERGALPVAVGGLVPGVHFALARGDGRQGFARFEIPTEGAVPTVELPAGPPSLGAAPETALARANLAGAVYSAVGKRADGVRYVLLGGVDGNLLHLQLYDGVRGVFSKAVELPFTGDCDDEAVAAVPLLLPIVDATGNFGATSPTAAPLSIADDVALARLLTQPPPRPPDVIGPPPDPKKRSKLPLVLGIVGGVVVAGGVTAAAVALSGPPPEPTGTVILQF